ncbi:outer mitochondrial membrane transport complex protein-domain-containing protein [Xylariaceae sp. FL0804]|nr:outer mitochondrial membrane transport complex protein-domain-containing protein [Xylariaceae sp. FL0804]
MELHVWGPALGCHSIDPECLAAITLFRSVLPADSWTLIASNDASVSPDCIWTSGYMPITSYLRENVTRVDGDLAQERRADLLAYASYLTVRGSGLLSLSLYASHSAWVEVTRPAYSSLLPFPLTWTLPPAIRAAALEKAEQMSMGYMATEVDWEPAKEPVETTSTGFMKLRHGAPGTLVPPELVGGIRLKQMAADFYSALLGLQRDKKFLHQNQDSKGLTSLDCLAYGYLSLLRVDTPHPVLKDVLEEKYGSLVRFLDAVDAGPSGGTDDLPWQEPPPRGAVALMGSFADGLLESAPGGFGDSWRRWRRGGEHAQDTTQKTLAVGGAAAVGLAAAGAAVLFRSLLPFGATTHRFEPPSGGRPGLHQFGEIGSILGSLPS